MFVKMWPHSIVLPIVSFFIGSIPFGALISRRVARIDITQRGSGNIGATNVARELGLKWGLVTLALDIIKGFMPVYIYFHYIDTYNETSLFIVCLAILLGHQYSPFQKFRGGKGVATALGIFLAISPLFALIAILIFVVTVYASDFISLGSMISACAMPLSMLLHRKSDHLVVASLIMAALICFKHRDNIKRLLRGEERRWRKRPVM